MDILNKAIETWGERSQFIKLNEELAELIAAVSKYLNKDVEKRHPEPVLKMNIVDEIADVEILIEQIKIILKIDNQVNNAKIFKLERLEKLLS